MTHQNELLAWAAQQLEALALNFTEATPIEGDAGFRQYVRLNTEPPMLAVYGPPDIEKHDAFVQISHHWQECGVMAPKIFAFNAIDGFLLVEDFGDCALGDVLSEVLTLEQVAEVYSPVLSQLRLLQQLPSQSFYPDYSPALLQQEMDLFEAWFVERLLGYPLNDHEKAQLHTLNQHLITNAQNQPQVIVHRDFHCRNIQYGKVTGGTVQLGLIDFQDAVIGPITYDWASLFKDCYQKWPAGFVNEQVKRYNKTLPLPLKIPENRVIEAFDLMGLQRHIKVLGIFARLFLRDGKPKYLDDLPLVIAYVRHTCARYTELRPFARWFDEVVLPLCVKQPWYCSVEIQS